MPARAKHTSRVLVRNTNTYSGVRALHRHSLRLMSTSAEAKNPTADNDNQAAAEKSNSSGTPEWGTEAYRDMPVVDVDAGDFVPTASSPDNLLTQQEFEAELARMSGWLEHQSSVPGGMDKIMEQLLTEATANGDIGPDLLEKFRDPEFEFTDEYKDMEKRARGINTEDVDSFIKQYVPEDLQAMEALRKVTAAHREGQREKVKVRRKKRKYVTRDTPGEDP